VPAAFFKIIAFLDKEKKLAVRAFIIVQDAEVLKDKRGKYSFTRSKYQVTVREIEERTGLKFAKDIAAVNPLFHSDKATAATFGTNRVPFAAEFKPLRSVVTLLTPTCLSSRSLV
jgi:endonuclease G, mitochondrial